LQNASFLFSTQIPAKSFNFVKKEIPETLKEIVSNFIKKKGKAEAFAFPFQYFNSLEFIPER